MGKKILVVDDDSGIQELLELALEGEGYSVTVACDGIDALSCIESEIPDLMILDLMMPRLDGIGLSAELTRRGLRKRFPIMVLSAAGRGRERSEPIHPEAFVDKPFSLPEFLDQVAKLAA